MSDSSQPHESQHARPPCSSPTPGVHSDSRPSSQWCHQAILSSVIPFSCPQSLPASESFPMSQLFAWGGQSIGVSALSSFFPKNTHPELFQVLKDDAVKVLHSICQQVWKTQQWPQDWKRSVFIPILKKGNAKECSNYYTIALISHASKVMLKVLQARLQQHVNHELPDVQAGFKKGRETKDQLPTSIGS